MNNIAITVAYDGTLFNGWQSQKNGTAIQDIISAAIYSLTGAKPFPRLEGCGRTDAGVHALNYVANFKSETTIPADRLPYALKKFIPSQISVFKAEYASEYFNARFSCIKKEYIYKMYSSTVPNPFLLNRAYFVPVQLDIDSMREAAGRIIGEHDFSCFRASGSAVKSSTRNIYTCDVSVTDGIINITVSSNGFLYNMVRIIAGTLYYVGIGKMTADDVESAIMSKDRNSAGITLPPHGLYLNRVWYPEGSFLRTEVI